MAISSYSKQTERDDRNGEKPIIEISALTDPFQQSVDPHGRRTGIDPRYLLLFVAFLLALRITGLFNVYFWEGDEISLAAGVAALVRDNVGDAYRYTPQLGYYRLVELIDLFLGGDVRLIPSIMKVLSALMGVVVPVLGLFLFKDELSAKSRWLVALVLAANPIIWKSSQYGNTALVALGVSLIAITVLSNRPGRSAEVAAIAVFAAAVLIRADTVLLLPLIGLLLYRNHRSVGAASLRLTYLAVILALAYGFAFWIDPRLDDLYSGVSTHFVVRRETMFWEYLIWAISPFPVVFSLLGLRYLVSRSLGLFVVLCFWLVPSLLFYLPATTTPRYFLIASVPFGIAGAIGLIDAFNCLKTRFPAVLVAVVLFAVAFMHVFVGLGHFHTGSIRAAFRGPGFITDDGLMPTGALLYDSHLRGGFLFQSFRNEGFAKTSVPYWEGPVMTEALTILAEPGRSNRTVILLEGGFWHAFHYHAQEFGAVYVSRAPTDPSFPFSSETWIELGGAEVMTIARESPHFSDLKSIAVKEGDEVWLMGENPFPAKDFLSKFPKNAELKPISTISEKIRIFKVTEWGT